MILHGAKIVIVVGAALVGSLAVAAVHAQESKGAQETKPPPDIRMLLTQPQNKVSADSVGAPDLRDLPMPKIDKPPVQPPVTIIVDDGHCYPGEDGMGGVTRFNRRPPRSH